ncbi:MAG: TIM barrel protein [Acidobacteria bacterium]|nr:TIM barrel protein [Acidobacteriota bacterium]
MSRYTRRQVLAGAALAAAAPAGPAKKPTLCLFSKHLPGLSYPELAKALQQMGFPGVDLTVRPGGHVLPENAERDLPRAHEALASEGVSVPMITTGLLSNADPAARPTLYTAAKLGIPFFKLGYYRYKNLANMVEERRAAKPQIDSLAALAGHAKIQGGFHNHSGAYIGSSVWDSWNLLEDVATNAIGFYFDPCHATIEGGKAGWELSFYRVAPRLNMVACKDFYWEKSKGKWDARMCPLGQGMVNYPKFFDMLAGTGFAGPLSLHVEYEIDGPTEAARQEKTLEAVERDYAYLKQEYARAFGA